MTDSSNILRQTVAAFLKLDPGEVTGGLDLRQKLRTSVARGGLDAAIRRQLHITCADVYTVQTYAQLEAAVFGQPVPAPVPTAPIPVSVQNGFSNLSPEGAAPSAVDWNEVECGVDVECPENLPVEHDYWESDFYRAHFTPREIAYCVSQVDPRQHFAARWCAKEALKKCGPGWLAIEMNRLEIVVSARGKPHFCLLSDGETAVLPVAVSLTHTSTLALAFVVIVRARPVRSPALPNLPADTQVAPGAPLAAQNRKGWLRRLLGT